ncbi:hypothetical protein VTJ83DRAFT_1328 [Remersonia thermophila]|uniref:LDB19 N-terminal domain-containing protein n=1 Tax=Remersonia thermophila TaxID=72144 RepID=A0ABR4DNR4_9PEZI
MPHRVVDFLRQSTQSLENQVSSLTKKSAAFDTRKRRHPPGRTAQGTKSAKPTRSSFGLDRDSDAAAPPYSPRATMSNSRPISFLESHGHGLHHHHHRISFPGMHFGRCSKEARPPSPATLEWTLESPPAVMYGDPATSSGALISGQLFLDVKEEFLEFESVNATLSIHVTHKKPFTNHCSECTHQHTELKKWELLPHPLVLRRGKHFFPVSVLLEGHLPATLDTPMVSIAYELKAEAVPASREGAVAHPPIRLERILDVRRSLAASETPHHSVRVFPPTNIKASAHYPHVIHPIGSNTLSLRLDGIAKHNAKVNTIEYWKLKKLTWKLEETIRTVAPVCGRHSPKTPSESGDAGAPEEPPAKKGVMRSETRVIGEHTLLSGWKSNYASLTDSTVELELEYCLGKNARFACDTKSRDGTEVTHQLVIEMVVSQEWAPVGKPHQATHTGVGRILRMHFGAILTERAGIGISWDNEAPPIYQDVPPSPPAYSQEVFAESSIDEVIEPLDPTPRNSMSRSSTDTGTRCLMPGV